ncbi:alanine racemase [Lentibacillus amyloliquefaciens]|uniref:Alanine racemase n=1 Tax=Lentibacillus amyloliquefaciens TaxID=1472767 RepID=A0A0U3WKB2_9BACI|nr:alanine racemase [Lentibacillus amyloliquefaciens]ALX50271.1 alanine racemase [Lentibacillus amyloliquefaciens]
MAHPSTITAHGPTVAEVDLEAFKENVRTFKRLVGNSRLMAVIKTNAYGHGVVPSGEAAVRAGADCLGVTMVEEGAQLRAAGIDVPIHILSSIMSWQAADLVAYDLTASVSSLDLAHALNREAVRQNKAASVHLKIDTGLHRFGIQPEEALDFCRASYELPGLEWEGIYTHFSSADEGEWNTTEKQYASFMNTIATLKKDGYYFPVRHAGASTIAIERRDMYLDMVRCGIALFGYPPEERQDSMISLKPVMGLKSRLLHVHELPPGSPVGYGGSYVTSDYEKIAVVPIGHGDGYHRALSNNGQMLVRGQRAEIIGEVSLDQTLINVTGIPGVSAGDEVVLMGEQQGDYISGREIAGWMDSIVDEVLSGLKERVERIYK